MYAKMKRNKKYYVFLLIVAVLYAVQYYVNNKIFPVGDQTAFLKYAEVFHHQYLYFGFDRYFTWSSRLLIESASLLFSVHEKIFVAGAIIATFFLLLPSRKLVPQAPWLPSLFIFIFFPATEFLSAGSIPTYTNYIFPASFLLFSLYYKDSELKWIRLASLVGFAFAVMQEQLAVFAFLWILFEVVKNRGQISKSLMNFLYLLVSFLGIISARIAPGNSVRLVKEIGTWFPNFPQLSFSQKVGLGILDTGDILLSSSFTFVFLFLLVLLSLAVVKKKGLAVFLSGFVLLTILSQKLEWRSILFTLSDVSRIARESKVFSFNLAYSSVVIYYLTIFFMVAYTVWILAKQSERVWLIHILLIGFISRMIMVFSPTLYASGTRTFLPIMISLFIISCYFCRDLFFEFNKTNN